MPKPSWMSCVKGCYGKVDEKPAPRPEKRNKPDSTCRVFLSDVSSSTGQMSPSDLSLTLIGSNLEIFSLAELKGVTRDFSRSNFIGEGGFGCVYKGFIDGDLRPGLKAQAVAVKRLDLEGTQGHNEWLTEVIILGQLQHQHLVKLIGYCYEDEHRLLVYEFMAQMSLENHLFESLASLPWLTRLKIAVGAAKGLTFLHDEAEKPVIYRDFKASNILLDSDYNAKLSDFGLAKDGPEGDKTHVSTRIMGTPGYTAPDYIMSGHLTAKSDVYSFGVVLLELLTGRRSIDKIRPRREQDLVNWARPLLKNSEKLCRVMDPNLEGQYSTKAAEKVALVAYQCLNNFPRHRPTMKSVIEMLEPLLELNDVPIGPFVYMVVMENSKDSSKLEKEMVSTKSDEINQHKEITDTETTENESHNSKHKREVRSRISALQSVAPLRRDPRRQYREIWM